MDDLAKVFAEVIEFIVSGVFLVASLVLLVNAVSPDSITALDDRLGEPGEGSSALITVGGLAVVYALGIVAEGVSRLLCEWRLRRQTVTKFASDGSKRTAIIAADDTANNLNRDWRRLSALSDNRLAPWEVRKLWARHKSWKRLRDSSAELREAWRTAAGTAKQQYADNMNTQLKRLRIERSLLLSAIVAFVALVVMHEWWLVLVSLVFGVILAGLVNERFKRFLSAIVNCYATTKDLDLLEKIAGDSVSDATT